MNRASALQLEVDESAPALVELSPVGVLTKSERSEQIKATIDEAVRAYLNAEDIQSMPRESLLALKSVLRHGDGLDHWETPQEWYPRGATGDFSIDLAARIVHYLPQKHRRLFGVIGSKSGRGGKRMIAPIKSRTRNNRAQRLLSAAVDQTVRLLLLMRIGPAGFGRKGANRVLDPSTVLQAARQFIPILISAGLARRIETEAEWWDIENKRFFHYVKSEDFLKLASRFSSDVEKEAKRLQILGHKGLWSDVPSVREVKNKKTTHVAGAAPVPKPVRKRDFHLPFSDDYVSQMGLHSQWIVRSLGPALLTVLAKIDRLWTETERRDASDEAIAQVREDALEGLLERAEWLDESGRPIGRLPFTDTPRGSRVERWPVRTFRQVVYLMKLVQTAHLFVVGLPMAPRHTELTTLRRDCVVFAKDGEKYLNGRTWKLVDRNDGKEREWVLPDLAMDAIEQQLRLVKLAERVGRRASRGSTLKPGIHLWAQIGLSEADSTQRMTDATGVFQWYAGALGMNKKPDGQGFRVHRFRKTIARLAALAIRQAPKVLMHVFGHRNIETTLYYILADKQLREEIEEVVREMTVMKAKESIEEIVAAQNTGDESQYGGPAAAVISKAVEVERKSLHQRGEDWGADSSTRLAVVLTLNGKAWQLVRPGIFCTKYPGTESGPCNQSRGEPEPSRCQSHCSHRLEEPFLFDDVDATIGDAVKKYREAKRDGNPLTRSFWAKQIPVHIGRFKRLALKWKKNRTVREMLRLVDDETRGLVT